MRPAAHSRRSTRIASPTDIVPSMTQMNTLRQPLAVDALAIPPLCYPTGRYDAVDPTGEVMETRAPATANQQPVNITIRPIHDPAELRTCQEVQRRTWGITEDGYIVPVATLAAASAYGGLVLGAFDGDRLVGFSFAFRGVLDGTPILYSQLTGVLPEAQGGGTGRRIKQWQRTWAREQGVPLVAWAFDPLQAMNAHYNLVSLGAVATHSPPNFYGPREDALTPGLPTARLLCVWPTADTLPAKP